MTDDKMNLRALVEKSPGAGFLRDDRLRRRETDGDGGGRGHRAAYGDKPPLRTAPRNGYRDWGEADKKTIPNRLSIGYTLTGSLPSAEGLGYLRAPSP